LARLLGLTTYLLTDLLGLVALVPASLDAQRRLHRPLPPLVGGGLAARDARGACAVRGALPLRRKLLG